MNRPVSTGIICGIFVAVLIGGCRSGLPANCLSLVPAEADRAPQPVIRMTRGAIVESDGRGAVVMSGRDAWLLFDYEGGENRVILLFRDGTDEGLYERIGQRRIGQPSAELIDKPQGISLRKAGRRLEGSIDVFVGKSERLDAPDDPEFTEYPRAMRVVGYFAVPIGNKPVDVDGVGWFRGVSPGEVVDLGRRAESILPTLPVFDAQFFVPTNLMDRLNPFPGFSERNPEPGN